MTATRSYVEVECPHCGADFDEPHLSADSRWTCPGCGAEHRLGDVGQLSVSRDEAPAEWFQDPWPSP